MTQPLDYDHLPQPVPLVWLYRIALACGLVPMAVGTVTFLGFLVTRDNLFAFVGLLTLFAGVAAAFLGAVCLAVYLFQAKRAGVADAEVAKRNARRAATVLIASFPLAIVYTAVGLHLLQRASEAAEVVMTNNDASAADVTLSTGADTATIGRIEPGETTSASVKFGNAGLRANLTRDGVSTTQTLFEHMDEDTLGHGRPIRLSIRNGQVKLLD